MRDTVARSLRYARASTLLRTPVAPFLLFLEKYRKPLADPG
jgi:hypothetical protein